MSTHLLIIALLPSEEHIGMAIASSSHLSSYCSQHVAGLVLLHI